MGRKGNFKIWASCDWTDRDNTFPEKNIEGFILDLAMNWVSHTLTTWLSAVKPADFQNSQIFTYYWKASNLRLLRATFKQKFEKMSLDCFSQTHKL
jgi:hypothetical protein